MKYLVDLTCRVTVDPKGYYDNFEVHRAWKVSPPDERVCDYEILRASIRYENMIHTELQQDFYMAIKRLP